MKKYAAAISAIVLLTMPAHAEKLAFVQQLGLNAAPRSIDQAVTVDNIIAPLAVMQETIAQARAPMVGSWSSINLISQSGNDNFVNVSQSGLANLGLITQSGMGNSIGLVQTGNNNSAILQQIGSRNAISLTQSGNNHSAMVSQVGHGNVAIIAQR
jgi:hypothetical protein